MKRAWRRLVYLRALDVLLIADTVESTNAAFEKRWLLHALDCVEIRNAAGAQELQLGAGVSD